MNIYSNILGSQLDQTQAPPEIKPRGTNLVFANIIKQLCSLQVFTQKYGITLTFKSSFHSDCPLFLHKLARDFFKDYDSKFKYVLFPEFTQKGNLHYHGVIWSCYELPLMQCIKRWKRKYGISKIENPINYYFCSDISNCRIKQLMLNPKENSKCWLHYILKDYNKNGLWSLTNY